ncbi:MAG: heavy metal resistance protein, partial [Alphaproteobacteria bacterium]|nr:heavy metal resistance protein [Alphaproteobacteria bacterium]
MKNTKFQIAIAVVLAAFAGCLGALGAERWLGSKEPVGLHDFVHERLNLTADQEEELDLLEERYAI